MPKNKITKPKKRGGRSTYQVTDTNGKMLSIKSRKGESAADFIKRAEALDRKAGVVMDTSRIKSFSDLFEIWYSDHVKLNLSPSTARTTRGRYEKHVKPYIGRMDIRDITRGDVYRLLTRAQRKGLSANSIRLIRSCISRPYNWAINALGIQMTPPTDGLIFTVQDKKRKKMTILSAEDEKRFFEATDGTRYHAYFKTLIMTGMRPSEALGLQRGDILKDRIQIRRGITQDGLSPLKTDAAVREIPLTPGCREEILKHLARFETPSHEGWVFATQKGRPNMSAIRSAFNRALKKTAVEEDGETVVQPLHFTLYDFRHTYATRMAERNMPLKALQTILGHTSVTVTLDYYVGMSEDLFDQAAEIMELSE